MRDETHDVNQDADESAQTPDLSRHEVDDNGNPWLKPEEWPRTVDQAVDIIIAGISEEVRQALLDDVDLHFGLGMWVRNNFGLWRKNQALKYDCALWYARQHDYSDEQIAELQQHLESGKDANGVDFERPEPSTKASTMTPEEFEELLAAIEAKRDDWDKIEIPDMWLRLALGPVEDPDEASGVILDAAAMRLKQQSQLTSDT